MKKEEMIEYLNNNGVDTSKLVYKQIQKKFWEVKAINDELPVTRKSVEDYLGTAEVEKLEYFEPPITNVVVNSNIIVSGQPLFDEVTISDTEEDKFFESKPTLFNPLPSDKAIIMKDIVELMHILKHKVRGTSEEGQRMIYLHNTYFHRHDSVGCSTCVSTVFNRMMDLYDEYKQYYA